MTRKTTEDSSGMITRLLKAVAVGVPIGIAAALVFALIFCAVLLGLPDPMGPIGICAAAALYIGAFVSSLIPALVLREYSLAAALAGAGLYCLAVFIASIFVKGAESVTSAVNVAVGYGGCVLLALLSGLIARPRAIRIKSGKKSPAAIARARLDRRR